MVVAYVNEIVKYIVYKNLYENIVSKNPGIQQEHNKISRSKKVLQNIPNRISLLLLCRLKAEWQQLILQHRPINLNKVKNEGNKMQPITQTVKKNEDISNLILVYIDFLSHLQQKTANLERILEIHKNIQKIFGKGRKVYISPEKKHSMQTYKEA